MEYQHERPSIMILNDDCLYNIMAKLHILDLLRLKQVNVRFNHLCRVQFSRCKELNLATLFPSQINTMTNEQFGHIVDWFSLSLTSLEVPISSHLTLAKVLDVVKKCGKLESLKVIYGKSYSPSWIEMVSGSRYTKRISQSVRQLDICENLYHMESIFIAFPNLEELRFRSIQVDNYFIRKKMPSNKLKSLEIYAHNTGERIPFGLVPVLPMLEKLHLACEAPHYPVYSRFFNFSGNKKLKEIHMKHWVLEDYQLFQLGIDIYGQLETLGFHCCANITEEGFKSFLTTQPNLKTVDICCVYRSDQFFIARCLNNYVETRPVMEEPLTVITNWCIHSSGLSPNLNIVLVSSGYECAYCKQLGVATYV